MNAFASVNFTRGELNLIINQVPAHFCPCCGEACVDEDIAIRLLQNAEELSKLGIMDVVGEYEE